VAWLNAKELAEELEVSPSTVRKWSEEGLPAGISPEGKRIYNVEAVATWLAEAEEEDEPEEEEEEDEDPDEEEAGDEDDDDED
jgi:phage terminase Nu1 subunit (DNA packaging protein)